jgi:hypothetical protein
MKTPRLLSLTTFRTAATLATLLLLALPSAVQAQFTYTTNSGALTITGYTGPGGDVTIPSETNGLLVTGIGDSAFYDCSSLTSVKIPKSVTSIGDWAFEDCTHLTAITVDALNPKYSSTDGVLFNKNATTLIQCPGGKAGNYTIPNGVTNIGDYSCKLTALTDITIPNSVITIGTEAFFNSRSLTRVTVPDNVTTIRDHAFALCANLTNATIGRGVTNIWGAPFSGCTRLTAITVDLLDQFYSSVDGVLFNKGHTKLIQFPGGRAGSYTIPAGVTNIETEAFEYCARLSSVTIPDTVTTIWQDAFFFCESLATITLPNSVTTIWSGAFYGCTNLTSATIGSGVATIWGHAFGDCRKLTGVYFQGNAPSTDSSVFDYSTNVTVYYLPGTTGWGSTFGGRPTALWFLPNPLILSGPSFEIQTNGFGFIISWATNIRVLVEASTNLGNPMWSPVGTNTLMGGTSYFSDPNWTNHPARFYRLRAP